MTQYNPFYAEQMANTWAAQGVPQQKIAMLLNRAQEIAGRKDMAKNASVNLLDRLITNAGMQKTASAVGYVSGLMKEALDNGANLSQAYGFCKSALEATQVKLAKMQKIAEIKANPSLSNWAEGFVSAAMQKSGMSQDDSINLMLDVVDREKRAAGDPSSDPSQMFKQAPPSGASGAGDPSGGMGGPPMPPPSGAGGDPGQAMDPTGGVGNPGGDTQQEEMQLMQMLQQLPPDQQAQIVQQLLQLVQQGQGGQDPSQGGGMPPQGAGPSGGPPSGGAGPSGGPQPGQ